MSQSEEYIVIEDLRPGLRSINIKVKCGNKNEEREVISKKTGDTLRVTEALVGDATGCILLTLWNDDIDKAQEDSVYKLDNVYTTIFRGSLRLNIGKYGNMEEIDADGFGEINVENNLSDKVYEQQRRPRYGGGGDRSYGNRPYRGGGRSYSDRRPRRRY
ncbi:MAG: single-stranded DNA-binding protein [Promethearchaeota archaeon]